ncbi:MAG TPA: TetR/AcrR family transcriptional regulator [Thermoanaerobaculia bacterium]|nr:TetR/AcrR family transcriptional regulator [Thermoanaerobaculia bacterium]
MLSAALPTTPRQEEILDRTFELVRESGLANLTMKKVADRMGFTEPALYRHFPNKQALVLGLLGRLESLLLPEIEAAAAREDLPPVERLERIVLHHLGLILKTDGLPFLILAEASALGDEVVIGKMQQVMGRMRAAMDRVFDEMPEVPGEPPRRRLALPLVGFSIATAVQRRMIPQMSLSEEETLDLARFLVRRILGSPQEGSE